MRASVPTIHCDAEDGGCGAWDVDHYESCATTVGGVLITKTRRAPGWINGEDADFCPEHAAGVEEGDR